MFLDRSGRERTYVRDLDGADNFPLAEVPQSESVGLLNSEGRLEDRDGGDEVGGQHDVLLEVDGKTVRNELLLEDTENAGDILGPFVDNVEVGIGLNKTARGGAKSGTHVSNEETTIGLGSDLISNGGEDGTVALLESRAVRVGGVKVESGILSLQEGEQTTTNEGFSVEGNTDVMGVVATGWDISDPDKFTEGVIIKTVGGQKVC